MIRVGITKVPTPKERVVLRERKILLSFVYRVVPINSTLALITVNFLKSYFWLFLAILVP
jgi:hypothetical protein